MACFSIFDSGEDGAPGVSTALKVASGLSGEDAGEVGVDLLCRGWEYRKAFGAMSILICEFYLDSRRYIDSQSSEDASYMLGGRHRRPHGQPSQSNVNARS